MTVKIKLLPIEHSYKYAPEEFKALARDAGWSSQKVWLDPQQYFSVPRLKMLAN